jgi:hypothetical protein
MKHLVCLVVAVAMCLLAACGGDDEGDDGDSESAATTTEAITDAPTDREATDEPTSAPDDTAGLSEDEENDLRERAQQCLQRYLDGDMPEAYKCFSSDYHERCSLAELAALRAYSKAAYEGFYGIDFADLEAQATEVRRVGDRVYVDARMTVDGEPLGDDDDTDDTEYWIREGNLWVVTDTDAEPCSLEPDSQ